jgi:hypothetical protein
MGLVLDSEKSKEYLDKVFTVYMFLSSSIGGHEAKKGFLNWETCFT